MKQQFKETQIKTTGSGLKAHHDSADESDSTLDSPNKPEFTEIPLKRRKRKSGGQLEILKQEFEKDQDWGKSRVTEIRALTQLTQVQIYKWHWDHKQKVTCRKVSGLLCRETLYPSSLECRFTQLQRAYNNELHELKVGRKIELFLL